MEDKIFIVALVVFIYPGKTGREISKIILGETDYCVNKREVNQILYRERQLFRRSVDDNQRPSWYLLPKKRKWLQSFCRKVQARNPSVKDEMPKKHAHQELYAWQKEALRDWRKANYVGVIEAVTGAGKTRVATAAIEEHFQQGWKTAIIVPTIELQNQWFRVIQSDVVVDPPIRVGKLGGGSSDSLADCDVLVATASSACKERLHHQGSDGLLIADECHRYGSPSWSDSLEPEFSHRLGLTATFDRPDSGVEDYLQPYLHQVCYKLGYGRALKDGVIARFKIAFIGFSFSYRERKEYELLSKRCKGFMNQLVEEHGIPEEPFGDFMKGVNRLSHTGNQSGSKLARHYLDSFSKKRQLLSLCDQKQRSLAKLAPAIEAAERTILFTETKDAATCAVGELHRCELDAARLDASMERYERSEVLASFSDGVHEVIAAPRLLDEGVDVAAADLAVIIAASRNKRQMIQRMGRVLRKKGDDRLARIAICYVKDTTEDPRNGAHETFIEDVRDEAADCRIFDIKEHQRICTYLNDYCG